MRLVLDTNVWLDWLVFDDPAVRPFRDAVAQGLAAVLIDTACEDELARALGYRFAHFTLDASAQAAALARCRAVVQHIEGAPAATLPGLPSCRDPDDQKFLVLAAQARADLLLTRDKALLVLGRRRATPLPFRIATPASAAGLLSSAASVTLPGSP
jgi:putative PIN family toxin of toxin-antitoxin system